MTLLSILFAALGISAFSFAGAALLFWKKALSVPMLPVLVSFAAGVMLTAAVMDLLPEAIEEAGDASAFPVVLAGIVAFFFLERFVLWFHHHHETHGERPSTILVLVGDGVHNFIDGVAISAAFLTDPLLGIVTTLAIAAHEVPQEFADFSVLLAGGMKPAKALLFNFLSGLTAVAGALLAYYFLESVEGVIWVALAFSSGMFLYIACSDLIPELHTTYAKTQKMSQTLSFLFGIGVLLFSMKLIGH